MGKPPSQPEPTIYHFSHPHPLQLLSYQPRQSLIFPVTCSCCKLNASGWLYTCTLCNYFLHVPCSQLPQNITHPFDPDHVLPLIATPKLPGITLTCDACQKQVDGFGYRCGTCDIDLHPDCATTPMILTHQSHHHQLHLTFSIPYPNKIFNCDVCNTVGYKQWLYRCNRCGFDAHLDCAKAAPGPSLFQGSYQQQFQAPNRAVPGMFPLQASPPMQHAQVHQYQASPTPAVPMYQFGENHMGTGHPTLAPSNYVNCDAPAGYYGSNMNIPVGGSGQGDKSMSEQILQSVVDVACQRLVQGLLGGGSS